MNNNGILFDLDGTLWEITNSTYESVNEITTKYKLEKVNVEDIRKTFGWEKDATAKYWFSSVNENEALKLFDESLKINIENLRIHGGNVYNNLENILRLLKDNYKLYIVSNASDNEYIEAFLISSKLKDYFNGYAAAGALKLSKGETIKKVIKENNLDKTIYVGDTIKDLEATQIADVPFVQAKYGFGEDLHTEFYINSIDELPEVINKVLEK